MIQGNQIILVPATLDDREKVYNWCFHSEITKTHAGPPDYPDIPIPTFEAFCTDYVDYFFTGSSPNNGRGFIILHEGHPVGFISYTSFHLKPHLSELDIWMNCEANCGKGFGTDAIITLGNHLCQTLDIRMLIMRPSSKNIRAIKSYEKVGFKKSNKLPDEYLLEEHAAIYGLGDYGEGGDTLLMKQL